MAYAGSESREMGAPAWLKDFRSRDRIKTYPGRIDPSQFEDEGAVRVVANGAASGGTNEQQTITIDATGGTFTVTYDGQTTGAVAYNAAAGTLEDALEALSNLAPGDVEVTKAGSVFTLTFGGTLAKTNVAAVTTNAASLTGGASTATVATSTPGAAGATSIAVDALSGPIPAGALLEWPNGISKTTAAAAAGDTSIAVETLTFNIADNAVSRYSKYGRKYIPSGTPVGRTRAERDANTAYGPADENDDDYGFTVYDILDATVDPDCVVLRPGIETQIAENHLPQIATDMFDASANLLTKYRAGFDMFTAED